MKWQRTGYKTNGCRKYTLAGEKAICYLLPYFLGSVDDSFSAVHAYFLLLNGDVKEGSAVVTLIGRFTAELSDDVVPDVAQDEMTINVRKFDREESSLVIHITFKREYSQSSFPFATNIKLEAKGNAKCESCSHDFVRDLMHCAENRTIQIDPLYFRCGRCRRLQLFVLLHKKLGRDLAKMIVVMAKNQGSV